RSTSASRCRCSRSPRGCCLPSDRASTGNGLSRSWRRARSGRRCCGRARRSSSTRPTRRGSTSASCTRTSSSPSTRRESSGSRSLPPSAPTRCSRGQRRSDTSGATSPPSSRPSSKSRMRSWTDVLETLSPRATEREDRLPPLLIVLTFVTGLVDAVAYLRLGHVFVANMTGNVVFVGFAAGGASGFSVWGSLLALACFLPGGMAAGRLTSPLGDDRRRQLSAAATVEVVLCAIAVAAAALGGRQLGAGSRYLLIAVLALAMGVQNATARRLAVADLTTTVLTLTLTG